MPFTLAATLRIKKKHVAEFTRLVKRHAANSVTKEPGCVSFEVSVDRDDPLRFIFYEIYLTEADFQAHTETPWFKRQMERTGHMVDGDFEIFCFGNRIAAPNK
jgi:quinol monooxygenase YgiN